MNSDEAMAQLCAVLDAKYGKDHEFDEKVGVMVGKRRARFDAAMADRQAAELLPLGRLIAAERLGKGVSTIYKMTHRAKKFSTAKAEA